MVSLFFGTISSLDYGAGTAGVTLPDRENQVIQDVPFLSMIYEMPKPGDIVAVLFEEVGGQIGKGVILGKIFLKGSKPKETGPDIFYKEFTDGAGMKYTPSLQKLEIRTKKVVVDELIYKTLTQE